MTARECKNGCGRMLEWDPNQQSKRPGGGAFVEVATGVKHNCPNFTKTDFQGKPYSGPPSTNSQANSLVDIETKLDTVLELLKAIIAENSYKKATEL